MTELLTAAQMRAVEQAAIESGEVTGLELMERAGSGVVDAIFAEWPQYCDAPQSATILCGPGNNGGDGFVVARRLLDRGWDVEVLFWGDAEKLSADARQNHDLWREMGDIHPLTAERAGAGSRPTILVDAMFGTGLTRAIPLELANAYHAVGARDVGEEHPWPVPFHRVAVDCPSGLDSDSGAFLLPELPEGIDEGNKDADRWRQWWSEDASKRLLHVDLTLSFHRRKIAHALNGQLGKVQVVDIGLGSQDRHTGDPKSHRTDRVCALDFDEIDEPDARSERIWAGRGLSKLVGRDSHKYSHGHALILCGGSGKTGAARLAARGALRIGAGLVTLGVPPAAQLEVASQVTAIMIKRVADREALDKVLQDARLNALCVGPGFGLGARERSIVGAMLGTGRPMVLDADALSVLFFDEADSLTELLHDQCVLTPHAGEFAGMFPDIAAKLNSQPTKGPAFSKVDATREAAHRAGCVVLFKGADTVIASPDGRCSVNSAYYERQAPWLATAGSGDVLAGFITGLLARGFDPMRAAETGAWLHVECARVFGPGLIAEDIAEQLPAVFRNLGL